MKKDILEELLQTIEANATDNKVTITNVSLWADSWRKEQSLLFGVMDWVACKDKIPLDIENYLVYGDGQYTVTFYSVRRKEWNTDFEVTHYCKLPSPPCA